MARDVNAGRASVEIAADEKLKRGLAKARARLKYFSRDVQAIGMSMTTAAAGILGPMAAALKTFSDVGDQVGKMSRRTGLSAEAVQSLGHAAARSGSDLESLEKGVRRMSRTIWDAERGLSTAQDALAELGLSVDDLSGKSPEEQFKVLADALAGVEDASRKSAIAQQVFGRSGTMLLPMFEQGRKGIENLQKSFTDLGVTLSAEDTLAAEQFTDTLGDLWTQVKYGVALLGSALAPAVKDLTTEAGKWLKESAAWVKENRALIVQYGKLALSLGKWLALVGGGLVVLGKLTGAISSVIGAGKGLVGLGAALAANPIAAAFVGVPAVIGGVIYALDQYSAHQADVRDEAQRALQAQKRQNAEDFKRIDRLEQLAEKERLNNVEMEEARGLIDALEGRYGDLGIALDETAGSLEGVAAAQRRVSEAMAEATMMKAKAEVMELQHNLDELRTRFADLAAGWHPTERIRELFGAGRLGDLDKEIRVAKAKLDAARQYMEALGDGATREELTPESGEESQAAQRAAAAAVEAEEASTRDLADRLHRTRLELIEDEHKRRVALINHAYDVERRRLEEQDATREQLTALEATRQAELAKARQEADRRRAEENDRREREWKQQRLAELDYERDLRQQLAREEIRATKEGKEERLALLELERKAAVREAAEYGQDAVRMAEQLYDLRRQALLATESVSAQVNVSTRGTFSHRFSEIFGARAGNEQKKIAEATQESSRTLKDLYRYFRDNPGMVYGG